MNTDNVPLIICGVLIFVILLNAGLLLGLLRGQNTNRIDIIRKAIDGVRNPWREADERYDELRTRVAELEEEPHEE